MEAFSFMPHVWIKDAVFFSPNNGVGVAPSILNFDGESVKEMLRVAFQYYQNPYFQDAICGGRGPLAAHFGRPLSLGRFLELLEEIRIAEETKAAKKSLTGQRRAQFQSERPDLMLRMIDNGVPYACAIDGCSITQGLTLDHVDPLSRGGTDDVSNLQFLCRSHNSQKGAKVVAA